MQSAEDDDKTWTRRLEIFLRSSFCQTRTYKRVASPLGKISPFCDLFSEEEWHEYSYYETLDKWYGYSFGNPLGPTQGVGFVNELIARMTDSIVHDHTSTNYTLDHDPETFPEPEEFRPERFLDAKGELDLSKGDPASFVFGFGRRSVLSPIVPLTSISILRDLGM